MIIRPFLYDFKNTITSKTVIILVAIILLISLTIIPLTSIRSIGGTGVPSSPILYYQEGVSPNIGYHYLTYFTNQYGDGISGATVTVTFTGPSNHTSTVVTNASGLASIRKFLHDKSLRSNKHSQSIGNDQENRRIWRRVWRRIHSIG